MKVRTRSIPGVGGLDIDFSITPESLVSKGIRADEGFTHDIVCNVHLEEADKDVYLSGQAVALIDALCYRCGETFEHTQKTPLYLTCSPRGKYDDPKEKKAYGQSDVHQESEDGLVYFDNDELDLSEIVREQVLLSLPMRYLCGENCQGVCIKCGATLNVEPHHCEVNPS